MSKKQAAIQRVRDLIVRESSGLSASDLRSFIRSIGEDFDDYRRLNSELKQHGRGLNRLDPRVA